MRLILITLLLIIPLIINATAQTQSQAPQLFAGYREVKDVERTAVQAKIVDAPIHVSPLVNELVGKTQCL